MPTIGPGRQDGEPLDQPAAGRRPPRPVKLVATDLDGTLLDPRGEVTTRTAAAVKLAQEAGIHVVPVTGRPPQATWRLAAAAGLGPLGVCSNGAALVDVTCGDVIEVETIAAEVAARLVATLHAGIPDLLLAADDLDCFTHEPGFLGQIDDWEETIVEADDIAAALTKGCVKLIARVPGWTARQLIAELEAVLGEEEAQVTTSGLDWVDIGAAGITKAYALERLCDRLGVKVDEVVAIGDNHNDLPVLAWAGHALAPANAVPEVLAMVDRVLAPNAEDGVAQYLEELAAATSPRPS